MISSVMPMEVLLFSMQRETAGSLPLHEAAKQGICYQIKILATQIDINLPDDRGRTPLHYAAQFQQFKAIEALIAMGANIALLDNNHQTARDLLANDAAKAQFDVLLNNARPQVCEDEEYDACSSCVIL